MPILLILLLVASVLDLNWPAAVVPLTGELTVGLTVGLVSLSLLGSAVVSFRTAAVLNRHPDHQRQTKAARLYGRWRQVAFYLNVAITAVAIFVFGWGHWVRAAFTPEPTGEAPLPDLAPFAELLVPAPYLLTLVLNWLLYWPAERALFRVNHPDRPFWSLPGFWLNNARQFLVTVFLPVLLCVSHQTAGRTFPHTTGQWWYQLGVSFSALGVAAFLPLVIRPLLGLKRLPAGPVRERLEVTARRLGVRFTDLLLWPTRGQTANAMVIGVIPWARYVIFTDRLLDGLEPDELDAVFGHEAGHARYGHLPYYMLFLMLSGGAVSMVAFLLHTLLQAYGVGVEIPVSWEPLAPLIGIAVLLVYLFVVFGLLSRVCERQADIFGSRAGSCGDPACSGHDADTVFVPRGRGLCPTGLRAMVRALEKVLVLNGWDAGPTRGNLVQRGIGWVRAWQHGPMTARIDYLLGLIDHPERADRHDRRAFWFRVLLLVLLLGVTAAGAVVGGKSLLAWLL